MKKGHWEVKADDGRWHRVDGFQAAAYRADGMDVRWVDD